MVAGRGKRWRIENLWLVQLATDFAALCCAYALTVFLRFHSGAGGRLFNGVNTLLGVGVREVDDYELFYIEGAARIIVQLAAPLFTLYALMNLYSGRRFIRPRPYIWNILVANATLLVGIYVYFYFRRNVFHPRSMFVTFVAINAVMNSAFRLGLGSFLNWLRTHFGIDQHRTVLAGSSEQGDLVRQVIETFQPHGIGIVEHVRWDAGIPYADWLERVRDAARRHDAPLIIAVQTDLTVQQIMQLVEMADGTGASAKILSPHMDVIRNEARMLTDVFLGIPLVHFENVRSLPKFRRSRHLASRLAALLALALLSPLLLAIALAIRATSPGPALFMQERFGINRRPFRMLKFRTMHDRAEERQAALEEFNESQAVVFKIRRDPRVTPVGRLLRRFSLDELPQLLNVLKGDMTLVGPRPLPRRDFQNYYEQWHYGRHEGLPGLTGLWQVSGRSELDFHNMCLLDIYYLHNQSWALDLKLLFRSAWVILFGDGAY